MEGFKSHTSIYLYDERNIPVAEMSSLFTAVVELSNKTKIQIIESHFTHEPYHHSSSKKIGIEN